MGNDKNIPLHLDFLTKKELNTEIKDIREYVRIYSSFSVVNYFYKQCSNITYYYNNGKR